MDIPTDWLLAGGTWIEYRTRLDLLRQTEEAPQVAAARAATLADQQVIQLIDEVSEWPWKVISSHKSAGQSFHKLTFLADLGIESVDPKMDALIARILTRQDAQGPFQLPVNIPVHFGGTGQDQWAWSLCDAPLIVYALAKFGLDTHLAVKAAAHYLAGLVTENGWPCAASKELGRFRGPGRKEDPCPFANLAMLKALSELDEWRDSPSVHKGADVLLDLWEGSLARHPYIFYMGSDFRKLKVPFIWYDLVHVLDVLSRFPWLRNDPHLLDMLVVLKRKMDAEGRFSLESVWTVWKDWELGQKKAPSRWLTLCAWRIIDRMEAGLG